METIRDVLLEAARRRSLREAALLAGEFARAAAGQREAILDAMQFEQWLAEGCQDCL